MADRSWHVHLDGERAIVRRSLASVLAPYVVHLALTMAWYPLAAFVLGVLDVPPSATIAMLAFVAPVAAMSLWVPKLAAERRRVVLKRAGDALEIDRASYARAALVEVVVMPDPAWLQPQRHVVLVAYSAEPDFVATIPIAHDRGVEHARGLATELAAWLELPVASAATAPPRATVHRSA